MASILVLDDDVAILEFARAALSGAHGVTCHTNGEEGLAACSTTCFDVVVTDLFMPYKDGIEFIREVKDLCPGIKIIAITGENAPLVKNYLDLAGDLGAKILLRKPLQIAQLREAVDKVLAGAA